MIPGGKFIVLLLALALGGAGLVFATLFFFSRPEFRVQWDWNHSGEGGVSSRTAEALKQFQGGGRLTLFLFPDERRFLANGSAVYPKAFNRLRTLSESARIQSNGKLEVQIHQRGSSLVEASAAEARLKRIPGQVLFLEYGNRKESLRFQDLFQVAEAGPRGEPARLLRERADSALGNAALFLSSGQPPKAIFLGGSGQGDLGDPQGLGPLSSIFKSEGWEVEWVSGASQAGPMDLLVVAGQTRPMGSRDQEAIVQWVHEGGSLLLGLGPPGSQSIVDFWHRVLQPLGFSFRDGIVCEPIRTTAGLVEGSPGCSDLEISPGQLSANHPVTRVLCNSRRGLFLPGCRPLSLGRGDNRYSRERLARSRAVAWLETDNPPDFSRGPKETFGIHALVLSAEFLAPSNLSRPGKALVLGSGLALRGRGATLSRDFLASSLRWFRGGSLEESQLLTLANQPWSPTPDQRLRIANLSILALPGTAFLLAFLAWWRRRR
jgi:hypothetical protein